MTVGHIVMHGLKISPQYRTSWPGIIILSLHQDRSRLEAGNTSAPPFVYPARRDLNWSPARTRGHRFRVFPMIKLWVYWFFIYSNFHNSLFEGLWKIGLWKVLVIEDSNYEYRVEFELKEIKIMENWVWIRESPHPNSAYLTSSEVQRKDWKFKL